VKKKKEKGEFNVLPYGAMNEPVVETQNA